MTESRRTHPTAVICTLIATGFALYFARPVLVPVVFALFIIAISWPLQRLLQARIPKLAAAAATLLATVVAVLIIASLLTWGFGRVGQWIASNGDRFQAIYEQTTARLEAYGLLVTGPITDHFNASWLLRFLHAQRGRIQGLTTFVVVTFIFVLLGLMEVDLFRVKLSNMQNRDIGASLLKASGEIGAKMQKYMMVRTLMSIMTGIVIWAFALSAGMELATAWGVIAFALNYIPFLGPLIATVFPTAFALIQFESWQMALIVFLSLNLIQFVIGSYLEPRIAGAALSISPFVVLFAVFFWTFLWGVPGAFIGVPITIAILTICEEYSSIKWIADLLSADVDVRTMPEGSSIDR
jgi:AI-2 transport protein TqsA